jgi:ankyrin repeat protein
MDSPVTIASRHGHFDVLSAVLQAGAFIDHQNAKRESGLILALAAGHQSCVLLLMSHKASFRGMTEPPLITAARAGKIGLVTFLVSNGISLDQRDRDGNTALHILAHAGKVDMVEQICAVSKDLNFVNGEGV